MVSIDASDNQNSPAMISQSGWVDALYDVLKDNILNQKWPPGSRININRVARDYHVSITPVREALARLTTDRLVVYEPNQGFKITPLPSVKRMEELGEMRLLLEMHAVESAATRRTEDDLDLLRSIQRDLASLETNTGAESVRRFAALNRLFHQRIVQASGNSVLSELYAALGYHVVTGHVYQTHGIFGLVEVLEEHAAIIEALEASDPLRSVEAIRQHVQVGHARALAAYKTQIQ